MYLVAYTEECVNEKYIVNGSHYAKNINENHINYDLQIFGSMGSAHFILHIFCESPIKCQHTRRKHHTKTSLDHKIEVVQCAEAIYVVLIEMQILKVLTKWVK